MKAKVLANGIVYEGTAFEILRELKLGALAPSPSVRKYKRAVRRRTLIYHGKTLSFATCGEFINELVRVGELEIQ